MKTVLVLRAKDDAARTAAKLKDMGFAALLSPVIEMVATNAAIPEGDFDALLATSAKGLEFGGAARGALRAVPLHVVGARTAQIAQALGWLPQLVAGEARALLPLLLAHHDAPARFLYLAGRDRQKDLEDGLREAGHHLTIVETYAARAADCLTQEAARALAEGRIDAILHYSKRSAEIFVELARKAALSEALLGAAHLALSRDVAAPLEQQGCTKIQFAEKPDEQHLLYLLPP